MVFLPFLKFLIAHSATLDLSREEFRGKLLGSCSDLIQIFRIHYPFVFTKRLIPGSRTPASDIMDRSGPLAQRVDASLPM